MFISQFTLLAAFENNINFFIIIAVVSASFMGVLAMVPETFNVPPKDQIEEV